MSRTAKLMVLAFTGLTFVVALVSLIFDPRVALGAAVAGGMCVAWLAGMGVSARAARVEGRGALAGGPPAAVGPEARASRAGEAEAPGEGGILLDTLRALALSLETRDPYSRGGTARIMRIAMTIAETIGLDDAETRSLQLAVLLHDVGMAAAGDGVAVTNRPLTTVEWALLRMHPRIGAEILAETPTLEDVVPLVVHHHEHFDGSGYGERLAGEAIPLGARVLSVADAYVAMTSNRPYRGAMSRAEALEEISAKAGTQFDPCIVDAIVGLAAAEDECLTVPA